MECATAQVESVRDGTAIVWTTPAETCASCEARGACTALRFEEETRPRSQALEVQNPVGARPGDVVTIDLAPRAVVTIASLLYLFPALAAVAGVALGATWGPSLFGVSADVGSVLFLAVLLGASFLLLAALHPRLAARRTLRVTITGVLARGADPGADPNSGEPAPGLHGSKESQLG